MKVYLAGPDVFLPDAVAIGRAKHAICARHGLTGLYPLDDAVPPGAVPPGVNAPGADPAAAIYRACRAMMMEADAIVANLTPFRGLGADAGTAFELGFADARGLPLFGYTNVATTLLQRTAAAFGPLRREGAEVFAADGLAVEDFGAFDNLMLAESLARFAGVVRPPEGVAVDPDRGLEVFELCVRQAARVLGATVLGATASDATAPPPHSAVQG